MPELLKNIYNQKFFNDFSEVLEEVLPDLDKKVFLSYVIDKQWEQRELKQRMRHIAITLKGFLSENYPEAVDQIVRMVKFLQANGRRELSLEYMFFPDFIEVFGLEDLETSIKGIEAITQYTSAEFCVRPFILKYPAKMIHQMLKWSTHNHPMVRRLASEGCRPRLPWAMAIPDLKKDPSPILPILENLKCDNSETVRRSVANNLNDIAKDHPDLVLKIVKDWYGKTVETDWVVRHGCRTLLKKAHPGVLKHFGFNSAIKVEVKDISVKRKRIKIGEDLEFSFKLEIQEAEPKKLRIEYGIDYMKSNGKLSRKIFKITENMFSKEKSINFNKKQTFKNLTTRKHYPGEHRLAIIINGQEFSVISFSVINDQ